MGYGGLGAFYHNTSKTAGGAI